MGIVANEFFDLKLGRMGGFGWAALQAAQSMLDRPSLGYRPLFLSGQLLDGTRHSSKVPLLVLAPQQASSPSKHPKLSVLLTIDFRPTYAQIIEASDEALVVWVRDPRPSEDVEKIATLEIPGTSDAPAGITWVDCSSLGAIVERARTAGRPVIMASPAPSLLAPKAPGTYGTERTPLEFLPNPMGVVPGRKRTSKSPRVVFLGRLDPIKRPWVFVELARRFPSTEFLMLGNAYVQGIGAWQPSRLPGNVRLMAHVEGAEKARLLASAWMIVNTSIHEALPISFLEALHSATPIVSCQNPEDMTSRFGVYVGRWDGSGLEGLDAFSDAVTHLLDDHEARVQLGRVGRAWVRSTHTRERFLGAFQRLVDPMVRIADSGAV